MPRGQSPGCLGVPVQYSLKLDVDGQASSVDALYLQLPAVKGSELLLDGVLAPKPMPDPETWASMGDPEYRALYYALCKFNQVNRTGVEWKTWGPGSDEVVYSQTDTEPYYFLTLFVFLDVFGRICGPTARRIWRYHTEKPDDYLALIALMEGTVGGGQDAQHKKISEREFMEMMRFWRARIGVPRDVHAAMADFVPGMCNIFLIRNRAVMLEYERALAEFGGVALRARVGEVPAADAPARRREEHQPSSPHALLFAGEGSQKVGMLHSAAELPRMRAKLEAANQRLGFDVLELCLQGPKEKLDSPEYSSLVMYMAGWAAYEKLLHEDPDAARRPQAVAGIDVGEYVALTVAGLLPFTAGLELVIARSKAMREVSTHIEQAACSVAGLSEETTKRLCQAALQSTSAGQEGGSRGSTCQILSVLFSLGFVVGGTPEAVLAFVKLATEERALQVKLLPGQTANHSPMMHAVQWVLKAKLREHQQHIAVPWCDVYFGAQAGSSVLRASADQLGLGERASLQEVRFATTRHLCEGCWSPLRWDVMVKALLASGVTQFYELSPSKQLKALMKRISKEAFDATVNCIA